MIQRLSHTSLYVLDQDRALAFSTEKLGLEVRTDVRMGDFRWLTVGPKGQPDLELVLMPLKQSPMMDEATVAAMRALIEKGCLGAGVFATADCKRTGSDEIVRAPQRRWPRPSKYRKQLTPCGFSTSWWPVVRSVSKPIAPVTTSFAGALYTARSTSLRA